MIRLRAAAAVLLGASLLLAGCSGDTSDADMVMGAPAAQTESPGSAAPPDQPPAPDDASTADPATGIEMSGNGYHYAAPQGWVDITNQVTGSEDKVDTAVGQNLKDVGTVRENFNVVNATAPALTIDSYEAVVAKNLAFMVKDLDIYARTSIGGKPAAHVGGAANTGGSTFFFEQYAVFDGDELYTLSFAIKLDRPESERRALVDSIVAAWEWTA